MRNSTVITSVFMALCASNAFAQTYAESYMPWEGNKVQWNDFRATTPMADSLAYEVAYKAVSKVARKEVNGVKYDYLAYDTYFNRSLSWVADKSKTPTLLSVCQTDFDMWELCARKTITDYYNGADAYLDDVFQFHKSLYLKQQSDMYRDTQKGTDAAKAEQYAEQVTKELSDNEFSPEEYAETCKPKGRGFYSIGLDVHIPFSKYVTPLYGFDMDMGIQSKKSLYGLEVGLYGLGKCNESIYGKKGCIEEGEKMWGCCMTLQYGYNIVNRGKTEITPYVGAGVKTYDGGELYPEHQHDKGNDNFEKAGFSFGVGMMANVSLSRVITLLPNRKCRINDTSLQVKPYFSMTRYSGSLGWVPSINCSFAVSFNGHLM